MGYENSSSFRDAAEDMRDDGARRAAASLVSGDGKVLGGLVTLPGPVAFLLETFSSRISKWMTSALREPSAQAFTHAAKLLKAKNPELTGEKLSSGLMYALPYTVNALDFVGTAREHTAEKKKLLADISPLLEANKEAGKEGKGQLSAITNALNSGYSGNKMVEFALAQVRKRTYNKLSMDALGVLPTFAVNYGDSIEAKLHSARFLAEEAEHAPDKAAIAELEKKYKHADWLITAASPIHQAVGKYNEQKHAADVASTSLDKVIELKQVISDNGLDSPNSMASSEAVSNVAAAVEDIFQTYQKEQGYRHIPMHRMREVSKILAEQMVSGDMAALSLVNIVGNERLLNTAKDGLVSDETLGKVIKDELKIFSKNKAITSEEFLENRPFGLDDIRTHLQSPDKDERALAALLAPDSVLLEAGAKKEELHELHHHLSARMQEGIYTAVINALAQQTDEQLVEKGFGREHIMFIREHNGNEEGAESIRHALQNRGTAEAAKDVVLTELMGESSRKWQEYISSVKRGAEGEKHTGHTHKIQAAASHTKRLNAEQVNSIEI